MNNLGNKDIDFLIQIYNYITLGVAGVFGVFVRHIYVKKTSIMQKIVEYLAGALCAIYGANILCQILYHMLIRYNFSMQDGESWQKLLSLSAFLCGMFGLSLCEYGFNYLRKLKN